MIEEASRKAEESPNLKSEWGWSKLPGLQVLKPKGPSSGEGKENTLGKRARADKKRTHLEEEDKVWREGGDPEEWKIFLKTGKEKEVTRRRQI